MTLALNSPEDWVWMVACGPVFMSPAGAGYVTCCSCLNLSLQGRASVILVSEVRGQKPEGNPKGPMDCVSSLSSPDRAREVAGGVSWSRGRGISRVLGSVPGVWPPRPLFFTAILWQSSWIPLTDIQAGVRGLSRKC